MVKFRQLLITISIAATLVASGAFAQTNLTQILDTITNPDGTSFNGTVVITWNGYSGSGSGTVSRLSTTARVYNGALSVLLVPTTTASPGTYYQVVYTSGNGLTAWTETWQVPPSTTALSLAAVRQTSTEGTTSTPPGGSGSTQYATLPIAISQVANLASSLSTINTTLGTVQSDATALGTTVSGLSTTVAGLNTTVTGQGTTLTNLSNTVAGLNTTVTNQGASVSSLNTTVGSLTSSFNTQGTSLASLTSSVGAINATVAGNSNSISSLTSSLNSLTSTVSGNSGAISTVNNTVGGLSTNVTSLTNLVNGLNATVNTLSAAGTTAVFVDAETPSGTVNGANLAFSLSNTPAPSGSLTLFRNGLSLTQGVDYTLAGSAVSFRANTLPQTGDILTAYYRVAGTGSPTNFTDAEMPGGTINGTNTTFVLGSAPNPPASLRLFRNGILVAGSEYTLSGSSIIFTTARTPQTGDSVTAYYRH